jgi:CubicO group peptidase (beta-lactamase class C family)
MAERVAWVLGALVLGVWVAPASARAEAASPFAAELDGYLQGALSDFEVPGVAVAVLHEGTVLYARGVGVRDQDTGAPVDDETLFMLGSLSKPLTGTMLATLVDDGLVDWDEAVVDLLPSFAVSEGMFTPLIRMRDVLSHSSGVRRNDLELFMGEPLPLELVDSIAAFPMVAGPGEVFEYSNQMFSIGGFAAARAAGAALEDRALRRSFQRLMKRRVFDRIDMPRSTLDFDQALDDPNRAEPHGYSPIDGAWVSTIEFERFTVPTAPSGGAWSSISDMARFLRLHVAGGVTPEGARVISEESLLETHRAQVPVPALAGAGYGLGWGVIEQAGRTQLAHDGSTLGFTARIIAVPEEDSGFVILVNREGAAPFMNAIERRLGAMLSNAERPSHDDLVVQDRQPRAEADRDFETSAPVSSDVVEPYLGDYERGIRLSFRDGTLFLKRAYGEQPFRAVTNVANRFVSVGPVQARMLAELRAAADGPPLLRLGWPNPDGVVRTAIEVSLLPLPECTSH